MSSKTHSPSWSVTSLYSGHSWDTQGETWCAAVHGAGESNCPNSCQKPVTSPRGTASGQWQQWSLLCMCLSTMSTMVSDTFANKPWKFHQIFLQRAFSQTGSTTPFCSSIFQLRNKWTALLSHSRPKCNLEGPWDPPAELMGKILFVVR